MKTCFLLLTLVLLATPALRAEQYAFWYDRFGSISLDIGGDKGRVSIEYQVKTRPLDKILRSGLVLAGPGVFKTPHGTLFTLKHLPEPVINDGNRHINSGDWQLTVSGSGSEFIRIKPKLPGASFGDTPPLVYLGEKVEAAESR